MRRVRAAYMRLGMLGDAVAVQEGARQVHDFFALPAYLQPGLAADPCHHAGLQVLLVSQQQGCLQVFGVDNHCHALLRFGDGQLGGVEPLVFGWHLVQVNLQTIGQFANGDADSAGTEIIAAPHQAGELGFAEEVLNIALDGGIAFLHFGAAFLHGVFGMRL